MKSEAFDMARMILSHAMPLNGPFDVNLFKDALIWIMYFVGFFVLYSDLVSYDCSPNQ